MAASPSSVAVMATLRMTHRWSGGLLGLALAAMGLSGAVLAHKDQWISVPHVNDAQVQDSQTLARAVETILEQPGEKPRTIFFASEDFGVNRVVRPDGAGAYTDQSGNELVRWATKWERPEIWLFDLHHYLLAGESGEVIAGVLALFGLLFVSTGLFLWWPLRKTFAPRPLPRRFTRSAIVRHHRDLGIIVAPLLAISFATGALMVFRPLTAVAFGPAAPAAIERDLAPPAPIGGELRDDFDWKAMFDRARARFPNAEVRLVALPFDDSGLVRLHLRQKGEWLPNGRTMLWFSVQSGGLVEARDALTMSPSTRAYDTIYPIHSGKTGQLTWRVLISLSGLGLALLGTFAFASFWLSDRRHARGRADQ